MLRKLQATDNVIISFPMIAVDGQQADTINSLAANIIQPGGTALSNFSVASFTQPNSDGTHVANFGSGVNSLAFTVQNSANPYVVTFTDPTSGIEPTMREIWIADRYPWELSLSSEVGSAFAQVQSTFDFVGSHDAALNTHDATIINGVSSISNAVNSVFSQVQSTFSYVNSGLVNDVWDEVLTGGTHNISNSAGRRIRQIQENLGYEGGAIWIDTVNGAAGTENFENGTVENPVDNIADANTLAASIGLAIFRVAPGSSITFAAAQNNQLFIGENWTLALGGQDITGSQFDGATVSGIAVGTGTIQEFFQCKLNAVTHRKNTHLIECGIAGTQTIGEAGDYFTDRCHSAIAGASTPVWDFGAALNSSNLSFRNYSGGIELQNMGAGTGTYNMSLEGRGQVIYNANCSATSNISIRGAFSVTDNAGGAITETEDARFNTTQVFTQVSSLDVRVSSIAPEVTLTFAQVQSTFTFLGTHDTTLVNGVTSISNNVTSLHNAVASLDVRVSSISTGAGASQASVNSVYAQVQSTFVNVNDGVTSISNNVSSLHTRVASVDVRVSSIATGAGASQASVDSVSAEVSSNNSLLAGLETTTTIELKEAPEGVPRIEAGDTHQFVKNVLTDPQSVAISITAPDSTTIASLQTATQSGTSTNWYFFYDDQNSWHTTVESSGQFIIEWTIFRPTGNDTIKDYFEVIKTD